MNRCIFRSRRRTGWCETSARLFFRRPCSWRAVSPSLGERGAVGPQLVGRDHVGREALLPEQLAHQLPGRGLVPPALDQDVQHLAFVVHRSPEVHPLAGDAHRHLIEVPARARPCAALPKAPGDGRAELQHPAPDRLVGDVEPSFGQQVLDIAEAEREPDIQPDGVLDDHGWEPVAGVRDRRHRSSLRGRWTCSDGCRDNASSPARRAFAGCSDPPRPLQTGTVLAGSTHEALFMNRWAQALAG